jgi:hypothetical protein
MQVVEDAVSNSKQRAYRRRLEAAGEREVLLRLSNHTVALIDAIKERHGLSNRGQVLEHLIEKGRELILQQ